MKGQEDNERRQTMALRRPSSVGATMSLGAHHDREEGSSSEEEKEEVKPVKKAPVNKVKGQGRSAMQPGKKMTLAEDSDSDSDESDDEDDEGLEYELTTSTKRMQDLRKSEIPQMRCSMSLWTSGPQSSSTKNSTAKEVRDDDSRDGSSLDESDKEEVKEQSASRLASVRMAIQEFVAKQQEALAKGKMLRRLHGNNCLMSKMRNAGEMSMDEIEYLNEVIPESTTSSRSRDGLALPKLESGMEPPEDVKLVLKAKLLQLASLPRVGGSNTARTPRSHMSSMARSHMSSTESKQSHMRSYASTA